MLIYPNPVESNTTLEYTLQNEDIISIELMDLNGKIIKTFIANEKRFAGKHEQIITLPSHLDPGNYIIHVSSASGQMGLKITH